MSEPRFAGAWIEHGSGDVSGSILVTGEGPLTGETLLTTQEAEIAGVLGATYTFVELLAAEEDFLERASILDNPGITWTTIDEQSNRVTVGIKSSADQQGLMGLVGPAPAYFSIDDSDPSLFATMRGGQAMLGISPHKCTSGFAVKSGSIFGIVTAGHCEDALRQNGNLLDFVAHAGGNQVDAQWHKTRAGDTVHGSYRCNSGHHPNYCNVTQVKSATNGLVLCHWGDRTQLSCGTVDSTTWKPLFHCVAPNYTSACASTFIRVIGTSLKACVGDSGGPLFASGGHAYGIINGRSPCHMLNASGQVGVLL